MASLDFPASPTNGQVFVGGNGVTYTYNGTIWLASSMASQASDTPPANPQTNQLWFNSTLGQLFIYYTDANSSQWVPANPTPSGVPVGGGIIREVTLALPAATIDLFSLGVKSCKVMFKVQTTANSEVYAQVANSSTPVTANYLAVISYNTHLMGGASPVGGVVNPAPGYLVATGVISGAGNWITGDMTIPDLLTRRSAQYMTHYSFPTGAFVNLMGSGMGPTPDTGADGLRFVLSTGNFAAGSFVRVIGWP